MKVEQLVLGKETIAADGIFIIRATDPIDNIFPELALENQVVKVDRDMATNIKGVFAAGDCIGKPWQISKASGEGLVAIHSVINYLNIKNMMCTATVEPAESTVVLLRQWDLQ